MQVEIKNEMQIRRGSLTLEQIKNMMDANQLVTIPEFLQRTLLKEKWYKKNYLNSKEYITSLWKGQGVIDPITVAPIDLIIEKIKAEILQEFDETIKTSLTEGLELLNTKKAAGAISVQLDGQSRCFLGLKSYFDGKYSLGSNLAKTIKLEIDNKKSTILANKNYTNLPPELQAKFKSYKLVVNNIEWFDEFNDVVDCLVNKQKGFSWAIFQIKKQKNRFTKFVNTFIESSRAHEDTDSKGNIIKNPASKLISFWKTHTRNLGEKYDIERDGHQLFMIQCAHLIKNGSWPSDVDMNEYFESPTRDIEPEYYQKFIEYLSNDFFPYIGKLKASPAVLINYIVFRENLNKLSNKNIIGQRILYEDNVTIYDNEKLTDAFFKTHLTLTEKSGKHEASFIKNDDGVWTVRNDGYKHQSTAQSTENIARRMELFFEWFDFDKLVNKNVIKINKPGYMPSLESVAVYNNFTDVNDDEISISDLQYQDRSHYISDKNGGSKELSNLGLEKYSINRSRGSKNLEKKVKK